MLNDRILAWEREGEYEEIGGRRIFVHAAEGSEPLLLLLHGFPSSSYDFRELVPRLGGHAHLTLDFLGFGLSEKPRGGDYGLRAQADLVEEVHRRRFPGRDVFVVAHDMGTSVATELLARDIEGSGSLGIRGVVLFNGSIVVERASLTPAQKMLRSRFGPIAARLTNRLFFRQQFGGLFSPDHPLSDEEAEDQWELIRHNGGRAIGHETIAYIGERIRLAERWHGAVRDWRGDLRFVWGMLDPVATPAVLDALRDLRPLAPVVELPDLGHYPQIEDPARIADAVLAALEPASPG
jgi:pimeloyl-ACP methyl ester carboxylesterase